MRDGSSSGDRRFRFFLFSDSSREFMEIRDGSVCGRIEGELQFPSDDLISRRHCRFQVAGNEIYIEDFGSTNQTKVNSVPLVPGRKRRIRLNDVIEIGAQRLILTNQTRFAPAHVQDAIASGAFASSRFKAVRKEDGSLTRFMTGFITKKTLIQLDARRARRLALRHKLKPVKNNSSTLGILGFWSAAWGAALYLMFLEGVVQPGLVNEPRLIEAPLAILITACVLGSAVFHHAVIRRMSGSRLFRGVATGLALVTFAAATFLGAQATSLVSRISENRTAFHCKRDPGYSKACQELRERYPAASNGS